MTALASLASKRVSSFGETVFAKYTRLAKEHGAINLGQGFPDFDPPDFVMQAFKQTANEYQQYAPLAGLPLFNETVANVKGKAIGKDLDPSLNVLATVGATEGLFAASQALIDSGDEVILLEPFYDAYPANVIMAGGIPKYVPLHPQKDGSWQLDFVELKSAFSNKTKAIFLNSPQNPTGKVFTAEELDQVIELAETYNAVIISDEAYEYIAFKPHISPASRPGGYERCLSISSIGKTFSVTGWKIGYVVGPEHLIEAVRMAHQWIPFVVATPLQHAAALALSQAHDVQSTYFDDLTTMYKGKHDMLVKALEDTPFKPMQSDGSYFVIADSSELGYKDDVELCGDLPARIGVGAIPPSAFYSEDHKALAKNLIRFAFCKTDAALKEAARRLKML